MCCYPMSQLRFEGSEKARMVVLRGPVGGQLPCSKDLDSDFGDREGTRREVFRGIFAVHVLWLSVSTWKFYSVLDFTLSQGDRQSGHAQVSVIRRESLDNMSYGLSSRKGKCSDTDHCFQLFEGLSCRREINSIPLLVWPNRTRTMELKHPADSFQL